MFLLTKPDAARIRDFIAAHRNAPLSYARGHLQGFTVDHHRILLGTGPAAFEKAVSAVLAWKMFQLPWLSLHPACASIAVGTTVAVLVWHFGFWSLNPCRIVETIDGPGRFGFIYGTVTGHAEIGEERFSVQLDSRTGEVWYDIYASSRPTPMVRLARPLARALQKRFAADPLAAMQACLVGLE